MAELQGSFTGVDAVRGWLSDIAEHFDHWRIDCDDFRDLGDRALALGTLWAVGKGTVTQLPRTRRPRARERRSTHAATPKSNGTSEGSFHAFARSRRSVE